MKREKLNLTEEDGRAALRAHVAERAHAARERYPDLSNDTLVRRMLADPDVVRFPAALAFDAEPLLPGEFAWAMPLGDRATDGYRLVVHPAFEGQDDVLPLLVAYHVVTINYLDVASHEEAELFGAILLGLEREEYYERLCALADALPGAPRYDPDVAEQFAKVFPEAAT